MDQNTQKLLEELSKKLGTTSEYLWGVLVRQAPISALNHIICIVVVLILGYILFTVHLVLQKEPKDRYSYSYYKEYEFIGFFMGFCLVFWTIALFFLMLNVGNIINGFFNPEYWALDQILDSLN